MLLGRRRQRAAMDDDDPNVIVEHGPSLAKGPALIAGSILVAFGLTGLLKNANFPDFSSTFPDGNPQGSSWLGLEVNGWTNFFAITAGALLLFGAAQHHLAKTMSLIVGAALAACAVIAIIDGGDVLGLAAANFWTKLGFAVAGAAMLLNALMPRTTRRRHIDELRGTGGARTRGGAYDRERVGEPAMAGDRDLAGHDVARDRDPAGRDAAREDEAAATERGRRFARPAEARSGIGRPAAERDLADAEAERTTVTEPGAVSSRDDDVPPRRA